MASSRDIQQPEWGFDRYQRCEKCTALTLHTKLHELRQFNRSPARKNGEPFDPDRYLVCEPRNAGAGKGEYPQLADIEHAVSSIHLQNQRSKATKSTNVFSLALLDPGLSPFLHLSLAELADSAASCDLCRALWTFNGSVDNMRSKESRIQQDAQSKDQKAFCVVDIKHGYRMANGTGLRDHSEHFLTIHLYFAESDKLFSATFSHDVTHNAHAQTLSRGLFRTHPFERVRGWLKECSESHRCAQDVALSPGEVRRSPSRLIDVGEGKNSSTLRLVAGVEDGVEYVTLSYCWGPAGVPQKLLESNYDSYSESIPYEILPQTFQDAIDMTRALEIRYLWIDALCIIQESNDWHAEAPRMVDVYRFSTISFAASASDTVNGGLFKQTRPKNQLLSSDYVVLGWDGPSFSSRPSLWANQMFKDPYESELMTNPLSERGWVFQERFLAPRTVHFAQEQIWFECRAECSNEVSTFDPSERRSYKAREMLEKRQWTRLVEQYSLLKLTRITDKVVAFAGAADTYGRSWTLNPADYTAGMWRPELLLHLLWHVGPASTRSLDYVAPSWSWASVVPGVTFIDDALEGETEWHSSLEILDVSISLDTHAQFGPVKGGKLDLACYIHPASVDLLDGVYSVIISGERYPGQWSPPGRTREMIDQQTFGPDSEPTQYCILHMDDERALRNVPGSGGHLDSVESIRDTAHFFMPMVMSQHEWHGSGCLGIYGLLLSRSSTGDRVYRRSGLVRVFIGPGFDDTPDWWYVNGDVDGSLSDAGEDDNAYKITII